MPITHEGNKNFNRGFQDGYWGRPQASDHPDYEDGYGRGYETAERQTAISIDNEKRQREKHGRRKKHLGQTA